MITTVEKEQINIKDVAVNEPVKEASISFDRERDLSIVDWQNLCQGFKLWPKTFARLTFPYSVISQTLFPSMPKVTEAYTNFRNIAADLFYELVDAEKSRSGETKDDYQLWVVLGTAIMFPDLFSNNRDNIRGVDDVFQNTKESFLHNMMSVTVDDITTSYPDALRDYLVGSLLFPDKISDFDSQQSSNISIGLTNYCAGIDARYGDWRRYTQILGLFRLLKPEEFKNLKVSENAWKSMKNELVLAREKGDNLQLGNQAFWMNIIAADEVKLDDKGLHITDKKPKKGFVGPAESIPVRRRF